MQGRGEKWNKDSYIFEGTWHKGKANGFGHQILPNGDEYEGFFLNDFRHGYGIYYYNSLEEYLISYGSWERGQLDPADVKWVQEDSNPALNSFRNRIRGIGNFSPRKF